MNDEAKEIFDALEKEYADASAFLTTLEHTKRFESEGCFVVSFLRYYREEPNVKKAIFLSLRNAGVEDVSSNN